MITGHRWLLAATVLTLPCAPLAAQDETDTEEQRTPTTQPETSAQRMMDAIIVTARKRGNAEAAQEVPISLTAFSGDQIEAMQARDLTDIGQTIPNVRLDDAGAFPGAANFTIRGMGFNSTIASVEPTVGLFVDGIYIGSNLGAAPDAFDIESVEVLRGPQGTLFGRNVTGGAVVMRSRRPDGEFGGVVRAGIGSGNRMMIGAGVEGPITDTLSGKIYGQINREDGDFDNITRGEKHGERDVNFVRPILRWQPSSTVDITLIGEYGTHDGDGVNARFVNDPTQTFFQNGIREPRGGTENLSINFKGDTKIEWGQAVLEANVDLGGGTLTSITGYREVDYDSSGDTDGSEQDIARAFNSMTQNQFSEELRYAGQAFGGRLDYTVGAYYFQQQLEQFYEVIFFGNSSQRSQGILDHKTWSVFAQGDLEVIDNIYLTAGGRYTWEKKDTRNARTPDCDLDLNCNFSTEQDATWKNFTPKLGLSWQVTPEILTYASWSKGFRSGGFNIRTTGANESAGPYDEETVEAYELGIKTEFFDRRLRVNAAVFQNKYDDLQRTVNQGLVNFIDNVASATVEGFEVEANVLATDTLALMANVGYLDARYDSYPTLDVDGDGTPDPDLAEGLRLVRAPEWSYTIGGTHDLRVGNAGTLTTRITYTHNGKTAANDANTYFAPSFNIIDGSVTWRPYDPEGLEVAFWIKNATNEKYALTATTTGFFTNLYQAPPIRFGADVTYKFR